MMRKILLTGLLCFLLSHFISISCYAGENQDNDIRNSIVKIFTVSCEPDYYSPWKLQYNRSSSGSGCIIKGERILTNAHVVSNQKFIEVQLYGDSKRYNAQVLHVSHEADLALLTVEDKAFFSGTEPLSLGDFPETLQELLVYGFPTGGDSLSITKGILSRVVYKKYAHSDNAFVAGQIDAAVNPGNSGGPVIVDNKVVGVVMQKYSSSQIDNIGYMIPTPMIKHFLTDTEDGQYNGFPELGFVTQKMENPGMRQKYGLKQELTGVLVTHVFWNSTAYGIVKKGDVVLAIDGHKIANNATVEYRPRERISYTHYADTHQLGDKISLKILREGKIRNIEYKLLQTGKGVSLVALKQYDHLPRYFIFGGIVFSPLSKNLIDMWYGYDQAPPEILKEMKAFPTKDRQEVVVAIQVLAAEINKGYHDISTWVIKKINGNEYKDFNAFYELATNSTNPFVVFENEEGKQIIIDREKADESHQRVLATYNIKTDRRLDVMRLFSQAKTTDQESEAENKKKDL